MAREVDYNIRCKYVEMQLEVQEECRGVIITRLVSFNAKMGFVDSEITFLEELNPAMRLTCCKGNYLLIESRSYSLEKKNRTYEKFFSTKFF